MNTLYIIIYYFCVQASQVVKMLFRAADSAYYSYMFANIANKDQYQIATSRVSTSVMIGRFSCSLLAQVFISLNPHNDTYVYLLYLSVIGKYNFVNIN